MSIGSRVAGAVTSVVGGTFMLGLALVLPAVAKLGELIPVGSRGAPPTLEAARILKVSLGSLLVFSSLVTLSGVCLLISSFVARHQSARG